MALRFWVSGSFFRTTTSLKQGNPVRTGLSSRYQYIRSRISPALHKRVVDGGTSARKKKGLSYIYPIMTHKTFLLADKDIELSILAIVCFSMQCLKLDDPKWQTIWSPITVPGVTNQPLSARFLDDTQKSYSGAPAGVWRLRDYWIIQDVQGLAAVQKLETINFRPGIVVVRKDEAYYPYIGLVKREEPALSQYSLIEQHSPF
ncbi:hypothetical protein BO70DRAFT_419939 [Aspergillus heteromorphus CBS 117.55]|uniref:Uncharacterized protein n=1 Tax=Aspergillus heteromorphus CBS 117.55 TaxID=1448321 RepID=A0A317WQD0_9EURO|nr:uncharacterized protein BO70DRAFT_419939 [Aspergillus heteromorphus CBS 117.55]PWY88265.1 hypothetical protein BO70DRAFT_419939 [Aspergillus heteromorphus CBS 117.55]